MIGLVVVVVEQACCVVCVRCRNFCMTNHVKEVHESISADTEFLVRDVGFADPKTMWFSVFVVVFNALTFPGYVIYVFAFLAKTLSRISLSMYMYVYSSTKANKVYFCTYKHISELCQGWHSKRTPLKKCRINALGQ